MITLMLAATLTAGALAQVTGLLMQVEAPDFDVTHALVDRNVDVAKLSLIDASQESACAAACEALNTLFSNDVIVSGDEKHSAFTSSYWSAQQASLQPQCIFRPPTADAVSIAVLISRQTQCPFAAKSGGHSRFAGASSIDGGILISFEKLNGVKISGDKETVAVGPGNTWGKLYEDLAKEDLAVIGGRVAMIGTGGLTTGGGISFLSNKYGWACDNVASYDVVLASGLQVSASPTENTDLYWALRGGGPNLGLVTTFHYEAISLPGGQMWGGTRVYLEDSFSELSQAFAGLIEKSPQDPNAGTWSAFIYYNNTKYASSTLWYAEPNGDAAAIFDDYKPLIAVSDSTANISLPDFAWTIEKDNPKGLRESYIHVTTKADPELAALAYQIFYEELPAVMGVTAIVPVMVYQGITLGQLAGMSKNGGNPLGLKPDEPVYIFLLSWMWYLESDDDLVHTTMTKILDRIREQAKFRNADRDFVYMNYAGMTQDVIASYGTENKARLKQIAKKYDPQGVFQKLQPGYFKLDRAPVVGTKYFGNVASTSAESWAHEEL